MYHHIILSTTIYSYFTTFNGRIPYHNRFSNLTCNRTTHKNCFLSLTELAITIYHITGIIHDVLDLPVGI